MRSHGPKCNFQTQNISESKHKAFPEPTRSEIEGYLRDIKFANKWLGGTSVIINHLTRLIGTNPPRQPIKILDVATGIADIPVQIVRWARRHGITVCITAIDKNPIIVEFARKYVRKYPEISIFQQDALQLPFKDGSFDFVTCSQIIHHLSAEDAIHLLRSANRIALQGIIVSDLRKRTLCTLASDAIALFIKNRLSKNDLRTSFRNAFSLPELFMIAKEAGIPCMSIHFHGPCRIAMVVDKRIFINQKPKELKNNYPKNNLGLICSNLRKAA